jgi:hypothetical protein
MPEPITAMATETGAKNEPREESPDLRLNERRRAAAYLDLWERHLTFIAVHENCIGSPTPKPDD